MRMFGVFCMAVAVICGSGRAGQASEVLLSEINRSTMFGEWEGAWRDRVAERLIVIHLAVRQKDTVLTLVSGPDTPFVEPFRISRTDCSDGHIHLQGFGFHDAEGASIQVDGVGWALASDGFLDVTATKVTKNGKKVAFDLRLVKLEGGFFKKAERLIDVARGQSDRLPARKP